MSEDGPVWVRAQELLDIADEMRATTTAATGQEPKVVDVDGSAGTLYIAALVNAVKAFPAALLAQGELMANAVTLAVWDAVEADSSLLDRDSIVPTTESEPGIFDIPSGDCECAS